MKTAWSWQLHGHTGDRCADAPQHGNVNAFFFFAVRSKRHAGSTAAKRLHGSHAGRGRRRVAGLARLQLPNRLKRDVAVYIYILGFFKTIAEHGMMIT